MIIFLTTAFASVKPDIDKVRDYFFIAGKEPCRAHELIRITESDNSGTHVIKAYNGAAYTILADCLKSPFNKLKNFNRGKKLIDEAVADDPENPEIRFIRFMVQDGAPSFLDYDNREEDLEVFHRTLDQFSDGKADREFRDKMLKSIEQTGLPEKKK
jgi:hypothetical protein